MVHYSTMPGLCQALTTLSLVAGNNIGNAQALAPPILPRDSVQLAAGPRLFDVEWSRPRSWLIAGLIGAGAAGLFWSFMNPRRRRETGDTTFKFNPVKIVPEEPLIDRLRSAQVDGRQIELFHRDRQEKYVGVIESIQDNRWLRLSQGREGHALIEIEGLLTVRDRDDDRTGQFVHPALKWAQLPDKSVNRNGDYRVLVDFDDPRLVAFIEQLFHPLRVQLFFKRKSQLQVTYEVYQTIKDYTPYDYDFLDRLDATDRPRELYRLGDFIDGGICNERAMLIQVALQYLGVESEFRTGKWGGGNHAWVNARPHDETDKKRNLLLDPQNKRLLDRGNHHDQARLNEYHQHAYRPGKLAPHLMTVEHNEMSAMVIERLLNEGLNFTQVVKLQAASHESWERIVNNRRFQIDLALSFDDDDSLDRVLIEDKQNAFSRLSPRQRDEEINVAMELYGSLRKSEKGFMFEISGEERSLVLPLYFIKFYAERRRLLHVSRRFPYGRTEGLKQALLKALRIRLTGKGYQDPGIDPEDIRRWVAGRQKYLDQFRNEMQSRPNIVERLLRQELADGVNLNTGQIAELVVFIEQHWQQAKQQYGDDAVLKRDYIRVCVVAYNTLYPHLDLRLREDLLSNTEVI